MVTPKNSSLPSQRPLVSKSATLSFSDELGPIYEPLYIINTTDEVMSNLELLFDFASKVPEHKQLAAATYSGLVADIKATIVSLLHCQRLVFFHDIDNTPESDRFYHDCPQLSHCRKALSEKEIYFLDIINTPISVEVCGTKDPFYSMHVRGPLADCKSCTQTNREKLCSGLEAVKYRRPPNHRPINSSLLGLEALKRSEFTLNSSFELLLHKNLQYISSIELCIEAVLLWHRFNPKLYLIKLERLSWVPLEMRNKQTSMSADLCG
ncbi:hypothetical protein Tco_0892249 [Tanacetum coccineum]|uniref:Uncharacterized protein n=1 Tax=Tanacetum coccineum TaxID=301880 RepID=A0ABQ5C786_9ASTR